MNTTTTTTTVLKNTLELKTGDIVLHHGMVIKLGERKVFWNISNPELKSVSFAGEILNVEEVNAEGLVPFSWRCETNSLGNEWFVQGNILATWLVVEN